MTSFFLKRHTPFFRFLSLLCITCTALFSTASVSYAANKSPLQTPNEIADAETSALPDITAASAVLIDNLSGRILYEKNKDRHRVPASITKIMTMLLIFEAIEAGNCHLDDSVRVSEYAASMGGSQVFLESGETQTVDTMLKCISIASANDAAVAMAEHIAGSETSFVQKMNEKAKALGMNHTHFKNCNGLDDTIQKGHYSSAYDIALMSRALITKYPAISKYSTIWMDSLTHHTKKGDTTFGLTNTNKLIRTYDGITGLKTGSTAKAKYCLSATACRNGVNLTAVIMGAPEPKARFSQASLLLDYGFAHCSAYTEPAEKIPVHPQKIKNACKDSIDVRVETDFYYTLLGEEQTQTPIRKIVYNKNLTAPVKEGDQIGSVQYYLAHKKIGSIPIHAGETLKKASWTDILHILSLRFLGKNT